MAAGAAPSAAGLSAHCVRLSRYLAVLIQATASSALATSTSPAFGHAQLWKREDAPMTDTEWYSKLLLSCALVLIGGVFSGLTLGLMGLDMVNLQVLSTAGETPRIQKDARTVLGLLNKGRHWVLCCLLMSNVVVNETLPFFLDEVLPGGGFFAVAASSILIVIFGEVLPQSACAKHGLRIGAVCTPFVSVLMFLEAPVAWPVARLLDYIIGESHGTVYKKAELRTFVGLHGHIGGESLCEEEVTIISSVLELADKSVDTIMTPLEDAYVLASDTILDHAKVDEIIAGGYSRIPVHTPGHFGKFEGMILVKKLASYDPAQCKPVSAFPLNVLPETSRDATCFDALNYFQSGRSHLLLVSDSPGQGTGAVGLLSIEDVVEELLGSEIVDETDVYVDVHKKNPVMRSAITSKNVPSSRVSLSMGPLLKSALDYRSRRRSASVSSSSSSLYSPVPQPSATMPGAPLALGSGKRQREPTPEQKLGHSHHASNASNNSIAMNTFPPRSRHSIGSPSQAKIFTPPPPAPANKVNNQGQQQQQARRVSGKQFIFPSPVIETDEQERFILGDGEGEGEEDDEAQEARRPNGGEKNGPESAALMQMSPTEKGWV